MGRIVIFSRYITLLPPEESLSSFILPGVRSGPEYDLYEHIVRQKGIGVEDLRQFDRNGFYAFDQALAWVNSKIIRLDAENRRFVPID